MCSICLAGTGAPSVAIFFTPANGVVQHRIEFQNKGKEGFAGMAWDGSDPFGGEYTPWALRYIHYVGKKSISALEDRTCKI